uniref:Uncharacterized protein n=1 Tax=Brassica oleracea var. oleracea TaxID=109376 RepID=A0A0D3DJJ8_BRAOL
MDCWEFTGTWVNTKPTVVSPAKKKVVKEDSPRPWYKAHKEAPAEASEEAAAEASEEVTTTVGTSSQNTTSPPKPTLESWSESVNETNAGRKSLEEDKGPDVPTAVPADATSSKDKLQNRALFYWTKVNPLFRIYRRRMLDIRKRGMLLLHFAVQRVIKQGNLMSHNNLLIRQIARPE